jgi:hypothetical protein
MENPPFPKAFTTLVTGLGAPKRCFTARNMRRAGALIISLMFLAASALVFLFGLYVTFPAYQTHGPAMIDDMLGIPLLVAFTLLVPGLAAGWMAYKNWSKGAAVYEGGIAVRDRNGIQAWRWEEIVSLTAAVTRHHFVGIDSGTRHVYKLVNRQNQRWVLSDIYTNVEELAKAIQDGIFPSLYEQAVRQYAAGQKLIFGRVAISTAGIQIRKRTFPWSEVQQVSIRRGILKVSSAGGRFRGGRVPVSTIPNLSVLISIINQVTGIEPAH